ncbi:hypothetical protein MNBD_ALPHA03-1153 [hydrothermal vent metagenome]|uniref:Uncharacterized protein n=1 Tax=hydrothermal vent metagenome TaxID=652676 RepID=A0A3B1AWZ5_9ZZZZ
MKYILSLITIITFLISTAFAMENESQKYQRCMSLAQNPEPQKQAEAVQYAEDWIFGGRAGFAGGVPAGHCKALALLGLGKPEAAAQLLEKLVEDLTIGAKSDGAKSDFRRQQKNDQLTLELYIQAALAWKAAKDYDKSYLAYSSALSSIKQGSRLMTNRALLHALYLERGTLQILRRQYKAAIEDITLAIEQDERDFAGFLQRAKAYRKRKQFLKARLDLRQAMILAPEHRDILLEQGILYRASGNKSAAQLTWQKVLTLYPESEHADLAQENLDLLKVD